MQTQTPPASSGIRILTPPPPAVLQPGIIFHDGQHWQPFEHPLFSGYLPADVQETKVPSMLYQGPRIPFALWRQGVAFMAWTFKEADGEGCVRGFLNTRTNAWAFYPYPQRKQAGLSVDEILDHPLRAEVLAQFNPADDWLEMFSLHHHCKSSAFQSGADHKDEAAIDGLHFTLGNLDKEQWSIHGRMIVRGVHHSITESMAPAFFEPPPLPPGLPDRLRRMWIHHLLVSAPEPTETFPEDWQRMLIADAPRIRMVAGPKSDTTDLRMQSLSDEIEWLVPTMNLRDVAREIVSRKPSKGVYALIGQVKWRNSGPLEWAEWYLSAPVADDTTTAADEDHDAFSMELVSRMSAAGVTYPLRELAELVTSVPRFGPPTDEMDVTIYQVALRLAEQHGIDLLAWARDYAAIEDEPELALTK